MVEKYFRDNNYFQSIETLLIFTVVIMKTLLGDLNGDENVKNMKQLFELYGLNSDKIRR